MSLVEIGIVAEIVSAIAVVVTLAFLAVQIRHSNRLAQMQAREHMIDMAGTELSVLYEHPEMATLIYKEAPLEYEDAIRVYSYLTLCMRQREWEWYQAKNGAIAAADAEQVKRDCLEVASTWLSARRGRLWWESAGRFGFNTEFATDLDRYMEGREPRRSDQAIMALEQAMVDEDNALTDAETEAQLQDGAEQTTH